MSTPTIEDRVTSSRRAQGLPARVEDPAVIARVATLLLRGSIVVPVNGPSSVQERGAGRE